MYPALKKHYGEDQEGFYQALEENCEFYNTNPPSYLLLPVYTL